MNRSKFENNIQRIIYTIDVEFENLPIIIKYIDWENQSARQNTMSIEIDCDGRSLKEDDPMYEFIYARFVESELFKGIQSTYNISNHLLKNF